MTWVAAEPEVATLLATLVRALRPRYMIETGSYHGATARAIGEALEIGHLDTIERDGYSAQRASEAVRGLPVTVHNCDSLTFEPTQPIDLAFLDSAIGDHRLRELAHFRPHLAPGATVAIHDARDVFLPRTPTFPGWRWVQLETDRGLLLLQED